MKFSKWIKKLEKKKIISEKPHPAMPFILGFIALALGFWFEFSLFFYLAGFTFVFAVLHLIVVINIRKK